jgi:PAS domain S-box-containing protein
VPVLDENGNIIKWYGTCTDINDLKQTEEAMLEIQNQFDLLIKNIRSGVALIDSTGTFTVVNPSFLQMFGLKDDETIKNVNDNNWNDWQVFESDGTTLLQIDEHPVRKAAITGKPVRDKLVGVRLPSGGDLIWMLISADLVRRPDGSIQSTICTYYDITGRMRAEEALRQSEERYRELVKSSPDAVIVHRDGQFLYANPAGLKLYGADSLDQLRSKTVLDLIPDDERAKIAARMKQGKAGRKVVLQETTLMRLDGKVIEVESVGGPVMYEGSPAVQILIRDVTERKNAQYALQAMLQRLHALVASINSYILFVGTNGIEIVNQAFCDYFKLRETPEDLIGLSPRKMMEKIKDAYLHPEKEVIRIQEIIDRREPVRGEEIAMRDGRTCLRDYIPILIKGNLYGRLWNHTDITNRKNVEDALRENERFLSETQEVARLGGWKANPESNFLMWTDGVNRLLDAPLDYKPDIIEGLKFYVPKYRPILLERLLHTLKTNEPFAEECELITMSGRHFWAEVRGLSSEREGAATYVMGTIQDISDRRIRENEREKYNHALQALSRSSQVMMRSTDEYLYMEEICKIIVEDCGYTMVWIGFAEDDEGKTVRPVTYNGFEEGYIKALKITWADTERGRGPTGTAIRTGKPATCRNMLIDPRFEPWRKEAIKRGYASSIVLPLMAGNKAFGALTIYSKEPDSFAEYEEKLLAELAADLSYGITAIRLREALRESEERFHAIAANTPDHILMQDHDLRYQLVINPQLNLTENDMLGKTDYDILELRDADKLTAIKRKVLESGKALSLESSLKNSRGEPEYFEGTYVPKLGPNGQLDGIIGYFRNTTEHKHFEEAIIRAKEEWERTFDTVPDLIAILDKEHRIVRVNKAMAERLKLAPDKCIGARCYEIVHGLSCPLESCPHSRTCHDGGEHTAEVHEAILGGDFMVSTTPLCDAEGQLVGSVHVARDITRRKAAEDQLAKQAALLQERRDQLEEINSELESFSYSVSHDLRAPLRAIDGFSRIILRQQGDKFDEKTRHQFNLIRDNVKLMGVLIESLLSFSRVQKNSMSISVIDMDKLAGEVWKEIKAANEEQKIELKIKKIKPGYGDHALIKQVLFNLLSNAVKFTKNKKQGIIEMSSYADDGKTVYCIKDNGAGFDMAHYDKLFGVFQRLHSSEEYEGTGIGLAIVQRIVTRHGGRVWAEAEVEKGATFCFTLNSIPSDDAPQRRRKKRNS